MALSEAFLCLDSMFLSKSGANFGKRRKLGFVEFHYSLRTSQNGIKSVGLWSAGCFSTDIKNRTKRSCFLRFKCQKADSVSGLTADDGRPASLSGKANVNNVQEFELNQLLKSDKKGFANVNTNGAGTVVDSRKSVEEEAWDLLKESVVYYCGNPIGTIAASDTSSSSILNYDQVFIRDFIPSGIAFLLKGEYDIVRNFILYTLQLQVI